MKNKYLILITLISLKLGLILYYFLTDNILFYGRNINAILWFLLGAIVIVFTWNEQQRVKGRKERIQTVFIVVVIGLILYFLSGLILGYAHSPYSLSFSGITRNLIYIFLIDMIKIYYRTALINLGKKQFINYAVITIMFMALDINTYLFFQQSTEAVSWFTNFFLIFIPILVRNVLITYLIVTSGFLTAAMYLGLFSLTSILLPIFPKYDWFFTALKEMLIAVGVFVAVNNLHIQKTMRLSRNKFRKKKPKYVLITMIFVLLLASFVAGFFKYFPLGIMSNSMYPNILRGDVVVVRKLDIEEMQNLQKGDIISYVLDGTYVIHRIVEVYEDGSTVYFQTQGDRNNTPDIEFVYFRQIKGKIVARVPLIGYPSVWLSETFAKSTPNVEY